MRMDCRWEDGDKRGRRRGEERRGEEKRREKKRSLWCGGTWKDLLRLFSRSQTPDEQASKKGLKESETVQSDSNAACDCSIIAALPYTTLLYTP